MFDLTANAVTGTSLAGVKLGTPLEYFLDDEITVVDQRSVEWSVDLTTGNLGLLLYKLSDGGAELYLGESSLVLSFNESNLLVSIKANSEYKGCIYDDVKVGESLGRVAHRLYLDDTNDVHHLCDEEENIISGIYFIAEGEEVEDDPDQIIAGVCIYNWGL